MTTGSWRIHGPTYDVHVVTRASSIAHEGAVRTLGHDVVEHAIAEWISDWGCQVPLKDMLRQYCAFESCGLDLMPGSELHTRARLLLRSLFVDGPLVALDQQPPTSRSRPRRSRTSR